MRAQKEPQELKGLKRYCITTKQLDLFDEKEGKKMKKTRFRVFMSIFLAMILSMSLVGCGGSSSPGGGGEGSGEIDTDAVLIRGTMSSGRCTLHPHQTVDYGDYDYMNQVYDTLVVADFDGKTIKAGLANSWEISEDGLTYTFHLKDNVKFHSGKPMTSADVKWTYDRWRDENFGAWTVYANSIDSIDTPDDYTVVLNLKQPDSNLMINLTVPVAAILNGDVVEQAEREGKVYGTEVIDGTGPFKFVEFIENDKIVFERNDEYNWGPEIFENKGPSHIKGFEVRYLPEAGTMLMEFQNGNVDILGNSCVRASELKGLEKLDFVKVDRFSSPYPVFIQFQLKKVPDLNVRRACNMAIDRDEINQTVMAGTCDPMVGALPSSYEWYWEGADNYYPYDLDKANQLLEDSGYLLKEDGYRYKDGKKLEFNIAFYGEDEQMIANLFQAQMKKIGVHVNVDLSHYNDFWDYINTNEFDTLIMALYLNSPEDMLYEYMSSNNLPHPNRQSFSDPATDKLLNEAKVTMDPVKRQELYDKIQEKALETAMWIPLYNRNGYIVYNTSIKGFKSHATLVEGIPKLLDVYKEK